MTPAGTNRRARLPNLGVRRTPTGSAEAARADPEVAESNVPRAGAFRSERVERTVPSRAPNVRASRSPGRRHLRGTHGSRRWSAPTNPRCPNGRWGARNDRLTGPGRAGGKMEELGPTTRGASAGRVRMRHTGSLTGGSRGGGKRVPAGNPCPAPPPTRSASPAGAPTRARGGIPGGAAPHRLGDRHRDRGRAERP